MCELSFWLIAHVSPRTKHTRAPSLFLLSLDVSFNRTLFNLVRKFVIRCDLYLCVPKHLTAKRTESLPGSVSMDQKKKKTEKESNQSRVSSSSFLSWFDRWVLLWMWKKNFLDLLASSKKFTIIKLCDVLLIISHRSASPLLALTLDSLFSSFARAHTCSIYMYLS